MLLRQRLDLVPYGYPMAPLAEDAPPLDRAAAELGYKLVCGLELRYHEAKHRLATLDPKQHEEKEEEARLVALVDGVLAEGAAEEYRVDESQLRPPSSDAWLSIAPEQLDDVLAQREAELAAAYDTRAAKHSEGGGEEEAHVYDAMAERTRAFLRQRSDYMGIELHDDKDDDGDAGDAQDDDAFLAYFQNKFGKGVFAPPSQGIGEGEGQGQAEGSSSEDDAFYEGTDSDGGSDVETESAAHAAAVEEEMAELMRAMDAELSQHGAQERAQTAEDAAEAQEAAAHVNLVRSFLESYHAQGGEAGPVSNLMNLLLRAPPLPATPKPTSATKKRRDE